MEIPTADEKPRGQKKPVVAVKKKRRVRKVKAKVTKSPGDSLEGIISIPSLTVSSQPSPNESGEFDSIMKSLEGAGSGESSDESDYESNSEEYTGNCWDSNADDEELSIGEAPLVERVENSKSLVSRVLESPVPRLPLALAFPDIRNRKSL